MQLAEVDCGAGNRRNRSAPRPNLDKSPSVALSGWCAWGPHGGEAGGNNLFCYGAALLSVWAPKAFQASGCNELFSTQSEQARDSLPELPRRRVPGVPAPWPALSSGALQRPRMQGARVRLVALGVHGDGS